MTEQEFKAIAGWTGDFDFSRIEEIYNNTETMKLEAFCDDYTKGNGHDIMDEMARKCRHLRDNIDELEEEVDRLNDRILEMEEERTEIVDFLISMHIQTKNETLRKQALSMVGKKKFILRKCYMALPLDDLEQAWVIDLLEGKEE